MDWRDCKAMYIRGLGLAGSSRGKSNIGIRRRKNKVHARHAPHRGSRHQEGMDEMDQENALVEEPCA